MTPALPWALFLSNCPTAKRLTKQDSFPEGCRSQAENTNSIIRIIRAEHHKPVQCLMLLTQGLLSYTNYTKLHKKQKPIFHLMLNQNLLVYRAKLSQNCP